MIQKRFRRNTYRWLPLLAAAACTLGAVHPGWAMIPEDILTQRSVLVGDLSPDGEVLLYGLTAWDDGQQRNRTTMYSRDLATGDELVLFTPEDRSHGPVWRPDGEAIAYLRSGNEGTEIWLMDADGGNRHRISQAPGPFGALLWSPNGKEVAWVASTEVKDDEGLEGSYVVADDIGYRHLGDGYRGGKLQQLFAMNVDEGLPRRLVHADLDVRSFDWSPDSRRLVFEGKARAELGKSLNSELWIVSSEGADLRQWTQNPGADRSPTWRADGTVAWLRTEDPLWESAPNRIAVLNPDLEEIREPTILGSDLDALFWRYSTFGDEFVVLAAHRGCLDLVRVNENGTEFLSNGGHDYWSLLVRGSRILLSGAGQTLPGALFLMDLNEKGRLPRTPRILVDPNLMWRQRVGLVEPEAFTVEVDGREIEGWIFLPENLEKGEKVPVVLSIHGGPEWMYGGYFLSEFHILPRFGYGVLIANPTGSMGYGFEFQKGIRGDWVERPGRELMACLDWAIAEGWADPERLAVMGGSYGGHLGAALTTQTNRFRAAALDRMHPDLVGFWGTTDEKWFPEWEFGGKPWDPQAKEIYRRNSPFTFVDQVSTPTLVSQGMLDYRCLIAGGETWFSALQALDIPSRFIRFENEGHGIRQPLNQVFYQQQLLNWFDLHVLGLNEAHEENPIHE